MPPSEESGAEIPQSTDQLKRALEDGQCFMWEYYNRRLYFEFVEDVGYVVTETDEHDQDPFTTGATEDKLVTAVSYDGVQPIDCNEIPHKEAEEA